MSDMTKTRVTVQEFLELPDRDGIVELINGEVVVNTPKRDHQTASVSIFLFLNQALPTGELIYAPMSVHLDSKNFVQPDIFWVSGPESKCQPGEDGYWHGAPDLVVEVLSPSTRNQDKRDKFQLYEKYGVREYWLADPKEQYVDVWRLEAGRFILAGSFSLGESFVSPLIGDKPVEVAALFKQRGTLPGSRIDSTM